MGLLSGVSQLRKSLEDVEGAVRLDPDPEHRLRGDIPGITVPGFRASEQDRLLNTGVPSDDEDDADGMLGNIFEIASEDELLDAAERMGTEIGDEVRQQTLQFGVEALGWYSSFHLRQRQWGIYLDLQRIFAFAHMEFIRAGIPASAAIRLAVHSVHQHELLHFAVDVGVAQFELLANTAVWWPRRSPRIVRDGVAEERLANGYMLRKCRKMPRRLAHPDAYLLLKNWSMRQPPGYSEGYLLVGDNRRFESAVHAYLCAEVGSVARIPHLWSSEAHRMVPTAPNVPWTACPIHLVANSSRFPTSLLDEFLLVGAPVLQETARFKKEYAALSRPIQRAWGKTRTKVECPTRVPGLDLKKWPKGGPNCFSVRVTDSYRAHLLWEKCQRGWIADSIGDHGAMGHG